MKTHNQGYQFQMVDGARVYSLIYPTVLITAACISLVCSISAMFFVL